MENLFLVPGDKAISGVMIWPPLDRRPLREREAAGGLREQILQFADLVLLVAVDDVERFEAVLGVDAEAGQRILALLADRLGPPIVRPRRLALGGPLGGDVSRLKEFKARFSSSVYPGDTLTTEGWKTDKGYIIQAKTENGVVLSNAVALVE